MTDKEMAESIMKNEYENLCDTGFKNSQEVYQSAWNKASSYAKYVERERCARICDVAAQTHTTYGESWQHKCGAEEIRDGDDEAQMPLLPEPSGLRNDDCDQYTWEQMYAYALEYAAIVVGASIPVAIETPP